MSIASSTTAEVWTDVRGLVARCHELGVDYASDVWSPVSDLTVALLLRRLNIEWQYVRELGIAEIIWPPVCGAHLMLIDRDRTPGERRLALRHGIGHVLAGHMGTILADEEHDWRSEEETLCDLFALADLIPDRRLYELVAAGYSASEMRWWTTCELKRFAPGWSDGRPAHRCELRLAGFNIRKD